MIQRAFEFAGPGEVIEQHTARVVRHLVRRRESLRELVERRIRTGPPTEEIREINRRLDAAAREPLAR